MKVNYENLELIILGQSDPIQVRKKQNMSFE